jgi:hypothetical protein
MAENLYTMKLFLKQTDLMKNHSPKEWTLALLSTNITEYLMMCGQAQFETEGCLALKRALNFQII